MRSSRFCLAVLSVVVLVSSMWLPSPAMWGPGAKWERTRQDDELIALALASKDPTIGVVYLLKDPSETDRFAKNLAGMGGSAQYLDHRLGYIRATVPTGSAYQALDVPPGDVAAIDLDLSWHANSALDGGHQAEPPDNEARLQAEINSPITQQFMRAPSPILHDLGADVWRREHPTYDGRGVVIADVENFVDPMIPELSGALTLDGKPIRKIQGMHLNIDPGDHSSFGDGDNAAQWLDTHTQVHGQTTVDYNGTSYRLPHAGDFRIGTFNLFQVAKTETHWLNPVIFGDLVGDGIFGVLWEPSTGRVWVDRTRSHDFSAAKAMRDYNASGDWSYFGDLHPSKKYPLITPAVSFFVLDGPTKDTVGIGIGIGTHAVGVTTSAAGNTVGKNDPVHGVAPAAQVASFEYSGFKLHSQAEAVIAAAEDPKVDVVVFEIHSGIHTTENEQGWFLSALDQRLVELFDKPIFVPGGNGPALASITDEGLGPDVISVSGSQSAASYQLYAGFRPSVAIHKHWGGLTDGPAQDGSLKPDLLAPSGYAASQQTYDWDGSAMRKPGLYTLPARYWDFGGTSQATPTAGGAAALLLSAAKQNGIHLHAAELSNVMRLGAQPSSDLSAHEQGNGLINIARSWQIIKADAKDPHAFINAPARVCSGSVRTAQWPNGAPDGGLGIFETIGWHPGDRDTRTLRFCLPDGSPKDLRASILLNDGTFQVKNVQTSGSTTDVTVEIAPRVAGLHSAIVQLQSTDGRVVGRGMAAVAAALDLGKSNSYKAAQTIMVPRPGYTNTYVDVPAGTDALVIHADRDVPFAISLQDPTGFDYTYAGYAPPSGHASITIPAPVAGAWEILFTDTHDVANTSHEILSVEPAETHLTVQAVRVGREGSQAGQNIYADVPVQRIGSTQLLTSTSGSFSSKTPVLVPIDVPESTDAILVDLSGSAARVDGYVLNCTGKTCTPFARIVGSASDKRLTIPHPKAGRYVVALDDYNPGQPAAQPSNYAISVLSFSRIPSGQHATAGQGYEVNCDPPGADVSTPKCGIFVVKN